MDDVYSKINLRVGLSIVHIKYISFVGSFKKDLTFSSILYMTVFPESPHHSCQPHLNHITIGKAQLKSEMENKEGRKVWDYPYIFSSMHVVGTRPALYIKATP